MSAQIRKLARRPNLQRASLQMRQFAQSAGVGKVRRLKKLIGRGGGGRTPGLSRQDTEIPITTVWGYGQGVRNIENFK